MSNQSLSSYFEYDDKLNIYNDVKDIIICCETEEEFEECMEILREILNKNGGENNGKE